MLENVSRNLAMWDSQYKWTADGDEWQHQAQRSGVPYDEWKSSLVSHLIAPYAGNANVVEVAPGRGRWSEAIINAARHATLVDISPSCLDFCRQRFSAATNVDYFLTTGTQLPHYATDAIHFVFSYNSFVHMSVEVIDAYFFEFSRLLRIGGVAIIHHADIANVGTHQQSTAGHRSAVNPSIVQDCARRSGLTVCRQFKYWDEQRKIGCPDDAVTLLRKDRASSESA